MLDAAIHLALLACLFFVGFATGGIVVAVLFLWIEKTT